MIVSDRHFASQIVAPYEEPRFFDDMGCLTHYLDRHPLLAAAVVYVADRSTLDWISAEAALFSRAGSLTAPMGSHLIAHASAASRQADAAAGSLVPIDRPDVLVRAAGPREGR